MGFYFIMVLDDGMDSYPVNLVNHSNLRINRKGYSISDIFKDYWDAFLTDNPKLKIRPVVFDNVSRMIKCKTPDLGYSFYACESCKLYDCL